MAQNAPIIQVDCASCGTTYRLALPSVIVKKTHKPMSFRCNNCSYKFQIHPKEILEQPLVAKTLILVESDGLQVHHNLESVADLVASGRYGAEDLIRVFGQEWTMLGDEPSLSALFDAAQEVDDTLDNYENELVQPDSVQREDDLIAERAEFSSISEEQAQTTIEENVEHVEKVEDVSVEFDEDSVEFSEQFSEIDPFATNSTEDETVFTETLDAKETATASEASIEDDDFDDWLVEELQDELAGSLDDNDLIEPESDDWTITESVEPETSGFAGEIDEPVPVVDELDELGDLDDLALDESFTIEDVQENQGDGAFSSVQNEFALDFDQDQDGTDDDFDDFAVEDVQANLLAELDLEESSFEDTVEALNTNPQDDSTQATDVERTLQALKSDLLGGGESQGDGSSQKSQDESTQSVAPAFEAPAFEAEAELDDVEHPDTIVGSERHSDSELGHSEVQKPKKRLSFSNKVPEVQKVEKREINQLYVFAGIIFFSMGVLGWVLWNSEVDKQEFAGMEVNSNLLKEMETPKEGLQENSQTEGKAPELAKTNADGESPPSEDGTDSSGTGEDTQIVSDATAEPARPFPDVLPDVPEEGIDFANDKSPRALTREGYRALRDNKPDLAIKLFELALKKEPNFADAVLGLGRTYTKRGELQRAVQSFCRHSELPSSSFEPSTMVEEVGLSQNILAQMGSSCEG